MRQDNRSAYRQAAAECLDLAQAASDPKIRERLTYLASKFHDLANTPDSDTAFDALLVSSIAPKWGPNPPRPP